MKQKSIIYLLFVMGLVVASLVARAAFSVSISPTSGPPGTVVTVTTSPDYGSLTTCYANGTPIGASGATYTVPNGVSSVTFYCESGTGEFYERTNDAVFTVTQPDSDGDGVPDGQDQCPNQPAQTANGCPEQPNQPNNNPNQPNQPGDGDGDGIPDGQDKCPNDPGHADNGGCPIPDEPNDGDGDGVPDDQDECPDNFGPAATNGCTLPDIPVDGPCTVGTRGGYRVNIRAGMSLNSDVVGVLNPDALAEVIGFGFTGDSPQEQEGWLQTRDGWVAARVTRLGGDCMPVVDPNVFELPYPFPEPVELIGLPEPIPQWDANGCPVGRPYVIVMNYHGSRDDLETHGLSGFRFYYTDVAARLYQTWRTLNYVTPLGDRSPVSTDYTSQALPRVNVNDAFWELLPDRETFPESPDLIVDSQIVLGTPCDDLIIGSPDINLIDGREGDDVILGLDGADLLLGGPGDDIIMSSTPFVLQEVEDVFRDFIWGGAGNDILIAAPGSELFHLGPARLYGGEGNDLMYGTSFTDQLYGGPGNDLIFGYGDSDLIWGGPGNDYLYGEYDLNSEVWANDLIIGQEGQDLLVGGLGEDNLIGGRSETTAADEPDALIGGGSSDRLWGGPEDYCDYVGGEDVHLPVLCNTDSVHESIFNDLLAQQQIDFPPNGEFPEFYNYEAYFVASHNRRD